ncbi:MAG: autoinducer binding domain-containing protein [Rhodospirillaceae bacterium]|nr:autoinducer binding domain-containing protein [Rhodospirillaceae bacterium]
MQARNLRDFVSDLQDLQSEDEFQNALEHRLAALGYNQFSYVGINIEDVKERALVEIEPELVHLTNRPDWGQRYVTQNYAKADPVVRMCFVNRAPVKWTENFMTSARTAEETQMMEDAWENGLRRGFTIPIHGPGGELGLMMLSCSENDREFARLMDEFEYDIQVMAYQFHDVLNKNIARKSRVPAPSPLTDREIEILRWTIDGKTAWEIGQILKISERTVNFHLQNVMNKFGVHNKTHAAAKAVSIGLIANI